jgi:hypothetical protein
MERRLLVNYRVDPDLLASFLPAPFRPALVGGYGIAGICLIRLSQVRPAGVPAKLGLTSENAAHRVAVCWDDAAGPVTGVYVPRRDTSSRLSALVGGRLFPGWQHAADFRVTERDASIRVEVESHDRAVRIVAAGRVASDVPPGSVFADVGSASRFFRCAPIGYAATPTPHLFDGIKLETVGWELCPLRLDEAYSSLFDDPRLFPAGAVMPDSAFLMGGLATAWHPQPPLRFTGRGLER